jgi:hypothetical protein
MLDMRLGSDDPLEISRNKTNPGGSQELNAASFAAWELETRVNFGKLSSALA